MAIHIANPAVVAKIERLAAATGLTKTAAVERAVDGMLANRAEASEDDFEARALAILAQLDRIPDRADAFDAVEWDELGLPRRSQWTRRLLSPSALTNRSVPNF